MKQNLIVDLSFDFALDAIRLYKLLICRNEFVISKQLLRAATSIGANVYEAQAGQSRKDFASKMAIASKEARETHYWLMLIKRSELVDFDNKERVINELLHSLSAITNILTRIVKSSATSETKNVKC
jgi:four helix bundle protein